MILTDRDIIHRANILGRPLVNPFDLKRITPNGYDLSIKEIKIGSAVHSINDGNIIIPPKTFVVGMSEEIVEMPSDMIARLWIRSSYGRRGILLSASVVDAGYCGGLALSMYNCSDDPVIIKKDDKRTICQIVFEQLDSTPMEGYAMRSGNYQNQNTLKV